MPYIKAKPSANNSLNVIYTSTDGSLTVWYGGSRAWRNNNPGNIRYTSFAKRHGAISKAGGFAVFPDYNTGRTALSALLRGPTYADQTLFEAVAVYAPEFENDVEKYRRQLAAFTGLDIERKIKALDAEEFELLLNAIQRIEGGLLANRSP